MHDEHDSNQGNGGGNAELEARVVAAIAGEASAFELAELDRILAANPELAIFKRRIEAVHGLVGEAAKPDAQPLRLSAERRAKLLQAIGAEEVATPTKKSEASGPITSIRRARRVGNGWFYAIAACMVLGMVAWLSMPGFQDAPRKEKIANGGTERVHLLLTNPDGARRKVISRDASREAAKEALRYRMAQKRAADFAAENEADLGRANPQISSNQERMQFANGIALPESTKTKALNDVTSSVSVVTNQFMADTGASNRQSLLNYTTAQERSGAQASFGGESNSQNANATPPAEPDEKPIVMDQFTVSTDQDTGYQAQSTLAGTRIQSELKDNSPNFLFAEREKKQNGQAPVSAPAATLEKRDSTLGKADLDDGPVTLAPFAVNAPTAPPPEEAGKGGAALKLGKFVATGSYLPATDSQGQESPKQKSDDKKVTAAPDADLPLAAKVEPAGEETPEVSATKQPVSTFSLHVSDVSFRVAQAALAQDRPIDQAAIRPEEFYNAFDYGDPAPAQNEKVACHVEQAAHPFLQQRNLVRIALKVPAAGRDAAQGLRLTVLLDTSGSMEREDRVAIARRAMGALASLLGPNDRLTLIGFARQPRLLAESLPGNEAAQVLDVMGKTPAEGGTNLEAALKLAGEMATRQFQAAAQNRIVVLTDGAANLGNADPKQLAGMVEALRQQGIAFDACGVGLDGLDDAMLERLTRKGGGRYSVLNSTEEADAGFARQLAGAFRPAAENVKLQVRFNPARVGNYRLIGFEQHRLREEDFRNDKVTAASLAAEEAAVAVYQVEALPQGEGELGEVYVRFRDAADGQMVERSWTLPYEAHAPSFDQATPTMQLAGTAALVAEKLRDGPSAEAIKFGELAPVVANLRSHFANEPRVRQLLEMVDHLRRDEHP